MGVKADRSEKQRSRLQTSYPSESSDHKILSLPSVLGLKAWASTAQLL